MCGRACRVPTSAKRARLTLHRPYVGRVLVSCARLSVVRLIDLLTDAFDHPSLVRDGERVDLIPEHAPVVDQQEGRLKDELFSIFGPEAKET